MNLEHLQWMELTTFNIDGTVDVTSENSTYNINTDINLTGGTGQVIDRLTTTNLADTVTNNSSLGMVVDLGDQLMQRLMDLLAPSILMQLMSWMQEMLIT